MFGLPVIVVAALVSYGTTGKGLTDNVASLVVQKDCALHYVLPTGNFCRNDGEKVVITVDTTQVIHGVSKEYAAMEMAKMDAFKASIKW